MPRLRTTHFFYSLVGLCLFSLLHWGPSRTSSNTRLPVDEHRECLKSPQNSVPESVPQKPPPTAPSPFKTVPCSVDGFRRLQCLRDENEVFFPFSFLKKHYDLSGRFSKDGSEFEWQTSYSKVKVPERGYDPRGVFGHFASYSVEMRERVRCINGETGVPMSTQWDTTPYYYPIQIAQYGLQHYSRNFSSSSSPSLMSVDVGSERTEWRGSASIEGASERVFFLDDDRPTVNISSKGTLTNAGVYVYLQNEPELHVVQFEWLPTANASFTVQVKHEATGQLLLLNYVFNTNDTRCVWRDGVTQASDTERTSYTYSLGDWSSRGWREEVRDVLVDASRALSVARLDKTDKDEGEKEKEGEPKGPTQKPVHIVLHPGDIKLLSLGFRGEVSIRQRVRQVAPSLVHQVFFRRAAQWFLHNQNAMGGWAVPVARSMADNRLSLAAGWHSAMAQGHALSVLSRAFHVTGDEEYLNAAVKGLHIFEKPVSEGGVRADLFGSPWFEEYPTQPSTFVLNGFIYSLIGLYDLSQAKLQNASVDLKEGTAKAKRLFDEGVESLKRHLPLYDTGSGSIYDLRHTGLKTAPNLARWDYHAVHVFLLKWMADLTDETSLSETADRWIGYSLGKRAKHN